MMNLQKNNFGLTRQIIVPMYGDYDNFLDKWKQKRQDKKDDKKAKKDENKERRDDKRSERQEKRELSSDKKRIKNELKQTQVDEKKAQLAMLNEQGQQAPPSPPAAGAGNDHTLLIVGSVVGVMALSLAGWFMFRKQHPGTPVMQKMAA